MTLTRAIDVINIVTIYDRRGRRLEDSGVSKDYHAIVIGTVEIYMLNTCFPTSRGYCILLNIRYNCH